MNVVELIRKKRDGFSLTEEELKWLITGYVENQIPDYQLTSFLMACYFQGMSHKETMTFTQLMLNSGKVVDLADIPGTKVDKHSTGGVGDKVSLILAPMVAACGVPVPMISGRGLGHTGGTLDKLQSIPGFRVDLNLVEYRNILRKTGVVMMGQTAEIAPADKKMYALRDVTGTIECIPLIVGSILSKKLAEGIDALVLDVKTGQGAFMRTYENSIELAQWLIKVAEAFCKPTIAFISDMNKPLGRTIGNWLEVVETVECLRSFKNTPIGSEDLMEITYLLGGTMLSLGKKASTISEGIALCKEAIANGAAYDKFLEMAEAQNGDISYI
jgi:pyrimidine-nucleoside phosphorylase